MYTPNYGTEALKRKAIIVDLDGTLANNDHRQHFITGEKKDWDSFSANVHKDSVNGWCSEIVNKFINSKYSILFVSGRHEAIREETQLWLFQNNLHFGKDYWLFMRKNNDYRPDFMIKTEIYKEHIEPNFDVLFCIDDRKQVVDQWRALGLVCLQCAEGLF